MDQNGASGELLTAGPIIKYCYLICVLMRKVESTLDFRGFRPLNRPVRYIKHNRSY